VIDVDNLQSWSGGRGGECENRGAVVVTLASTSISACSSGSLVSKGRFNDLCFRFTDDMVSLDDWKPNLRDESVMNICVVSEGTYEVCSKTTSQQQQTGQQSTTHFSIVSFSMSIGVTIVHSSDCRQCQMVPERQVVHGGSGHAH